MDMMHRKEVDAFVLSPSDSDYTDVAIRLEESRVQVVGIGHSDTPSSFVKSCDHCSQSQILENQRQVQNLKRRKKPLLTNKEHRKQERSS